MPKRKEWQDDEFVPAVTYLSNRLDREGKTILVEEDPRDINMYRSSLVECRNVADLERWVDEYLNSEARKQLYQRMRRWRADEAAAAAQEEANTENKFRFKDPDTEPFVSPAKAMDVLTKYLLNVVDQRERTIVIETLIARAKIEDYLVARFGSTGVDGVDLDTLVDLYKSMMQKHHPDKGGDPGLFRAARDLHDDAVARGGKRRNKRDQTETEPKKSGKANSEPAPAPAPEDGALPEPKAKRNYGTGTCSICGSEFQKAGPRSQYCGCDSRA